MGPACQIRLSPLSAGDPGLASTEQAEQRGPHTFMGTTNVPLHSAKVLPQVEPVGPNRTKTQPPAFGSIYYFIKPQDAKQIHLHPALLALRERRSLVS